MKQWWEKTMLGAISKLHSFHMGQRRKMVDKVEKLRAENHILMELNESFAEELYWYESVVGEKLTSEIEGFLQGATDFASANKVLHDRLVGLPEVEGPHRLDAIRRAGMELGMLCADEKLCPINTGITLYRFGSANTEISQERITETVVSSLRAGMRGGTV